MYNSRITYIRIQEIADLQGTSITEINKQCGISKNTISQSANTGEGMKAKKIFDIATFLGCSADYLLGLTDEPQSIKGSLIQTGSIGSYSSHSDTSVKISDTLTPLDEMSAELLKRFNALSFDEKLDIFNYIKNKEAQK